MSFRWPLAHNVIRGNRESNTFGMVRHDRDGHPKAHQGWDFAADIGTPCRAIGDGVVESVEDRGDYGLRVLLRLDTVVNGERLWAFYAHLSAAHVKAGDRVIAGQHVADTGESGNAKGMPRAERHLHFEVRTEPAPGLGLEGRMSPKKIFGAYPLTTPVED